MSDSIQVSTVAMVRNLISELGLSGTALELSLPHKCLQPNARPNWSMRMRLKAIARRNAKKEVLDQTDGPPCPIEEAIVQPLFRFANRRRRDPDNLIAWIKPIIDGVVDAGVFADDNKLIWMPPIQMKANSISHIELRIYWMPEESQKEKIARANSDWL